MIRDPPLRRNFAADDLAPLAAAAGVTATVVVQTVTEPDVLRGLAAVAAAGLTYDVVVRPAQLPAAMRAAAAPYYEIALDSFGPARLMFGSDWPVSTVGAPYGDVVGTARALTSDLSQPEQDAIFGGTARRVYQISSGRVSP